MTFDLSANIRGKCSKKNPATCRLHGRGYRERRELMMQMRNQEKIKELTRKTTADFEASWKVKEEKDGTTTASVYRSGIPNPPVQRGVEAGHYSRADEHAPADRQTRTTAVFASPSVGGAARWVRGNFFANVPDVKVREIRVDVDNTYIYSVISWEIASGKDTPQAYEEYWKTGITFRDYMAAVKKDPEHYHPAEWELLLTEEKISSVKPVGPARASEHEYTGRNEEVVNILKGKARP